MERLLLLAEEVDVAGGELVGSSFAGIFGLFASALSAAADDKSAREDFDLAFEDFLRDDFDAFSDFDFFSFFFGCPDFRASWEDADDEVPGAEGDASGSRWRSRPPPDANVSSVD